MAIIPKRNENNMTGYGTLPQALDVNMPKPQISGVEPVQPVNYTPAINNLIDMTARYAREAEDYALLEAGNLLDNDRMLAVRDFGKLEGKKTFDINPVMNELSKKAEEYGKNLSFNARKKYDTTVKPNALFNTRKQLLEHSDNEIAKFKTNQYNSAIKLRVDDTVANFNNPDGIADNVSRGESMIIDEYQRLGKPIEEMEVALQKFYDSGLTGVVEKKLSEKDDRGALSFFNDNENTFSAGQKILLRDKLKSGTTEGEALRASEDIWNKFRPIGFNEPINYNSVLDEVNKIEDSEVRKKTQANLTDRINWFNKTQAETEKANTNNIYKMMFIDKKPMNEITGSNEWSLLSGDIQADFSERYIKLQERDKQEISDKAELEVVGMYEEGKELPKIFNSSAFKRMSDDKQISYRKEGLNDKNKQELKNKITAEEKRQLDNFSSVLSDYNKLLDTHLHIKMLADGEITDSQYSKIETVFKNLNPMKLPEYKNAVDLINKSKTLTVIEQKDALTELNNEFITSLLNKDEKFDPMESAKKKIEPINKGFWDAVLDAFDTHGLTFKQPPQTEERPFEGYYFPKEKAQIKMNTKNKVPYKVGLQIKGINKKTGQEEMREYLGNGQWKLIETL